MENKYLYNVAMASLMVNYATGLGLIVDSSVRAFNGKFSALEMATGGLVTLAAVVGTSLVSKNRRSSSGGFDIADDVKPLEAAAEVGYAEH